MKHGGCRARGLRRSFSLWLSVSGCVLPEVHAPARPASQDHSDTSNNSPATTALAAGSSAPREPDAENGAQSRPAPAAGSGTAGSTTDPCATNNGGCDTDPMASCSSRAGMVQCSCPTGASGTGRGAEGCQSRESLTVCGRFRCGARIVVDPETALTWQRNLPATYAGCTGRYTPAVGTDGDACTWKEAAAYCEQIDEGWRVPTRDELLSIVEAKPTGPSVDTDAFPGTRAEGFWTSSFAENSARGTDGAGAIYVSFETGQAYILSVGGAYRVRCVR